MDEGAAREMGCVMAASEGLAEKICGREQKGIGQVRTAQEIHDHLVKVYRGGHADVFTDGATIPNPGDGGWAFIIRLPGEPDIELFGGDRETTNNRMEMTAVLQAIRAVPQGISATIYSDSAYVVDGINKWMHGWKANGWKRKPSLHAKAGPILNLDLWQQLWEVRYRRALTFQWLKGHAGHEHNERADALAEMGRLAFMAGEIEANHIPPANAPYTVRQERMSL